MYPAEVSSIGVILVDVHLNWLNWFHVLILEVGLIRYSDRLRDFSVTISRCYKDVFVNSFSPCTARLTNPLTIECFPYLTFDLNDFNCSFFLKRCPVWFNLFLLLFLATPCHVVALQSCMEWIPISKKVFNIVGQHYKQG